MRLIDADLMLDDMKAELEKASEEHLTKDEAMVIMTSAIALKDFVKRQPTVDAVEVVHGEWLRTDDTYPVFECSNCKRTDNYKRNYCPNCGAKMDGKVE